MKVMMHVCKQAPLPLIPQMNSGFAFFTAQEKNASPSSEWQMFRSCLVGRDSLQNRTPQKSLSA
jgi:hypothetical protein